MLGLHIPIVPVRGQMWASDPFPPRVFHTISAAESSLHRQTAAGNDRETPPCLTHRRDTRVTRHLYGRQTRDGEIIFGGDRQVVGYHKVPEPSGIELNHGHAAEILPFLREVPIKRIWAGLMPFSLDGRRSSARSHSAPTSTSSVAWRLQALGAGPWRAGCSRTTSTLATGLMAWPRQTQRDV
jgi:glycine/D-amino acid oxidase-like deaminating enzyme